MSIGLTNTANILDSTKVNVGAAKLTIIKASPANDDLSVAVTVDAQMTIKSSIFNQPTDNVNVTTTATKLTIINSPAPNIELLPPSNLNLVTVVAPTDLTGQINESN